MRAISRTIHNMIFPGGGGTRTTTTTKETCETYTYPDGTHEICERTTTTTSNGGAKYRPEPLAI